MDFIKKLYPLVLITTVMGVLLALTYGSLKPLLDAAAQREFERSLRELHPTFSRYEEKTAEDKMYYLLHDDASGVVVFVFRATQVGYGGPVEILTGITNGVVSRVVIANMGSETPGLGTKIGGVRWLSQFLGRREDGIPLSRADFRRKGIDGISGATVSSLAVTRGVHEALGFYQRVYDLAVTNQIDGNTVEANARPQGGV